MIVYYAPGGGLGHLTRARAVLHTLGVRDKVLVITSRNLHTAQTVFEGRPHTEIGILPRELERTPGQLRLWLQSLLRDANPAELYVDTFPAGILGELCGLTCPNHLQILHIARLLRWENYKNVITRDPPLFHNTFCLELLGEEHEGFVRNQSKEIQTLQIEDPPGNVSDSIRRKILELKSVGSPLWLIVHSGPAEETKELLAYAREVSRMEELQPRFLLIKPEKSADSINGSLQWQYYPAHVLFPYVDQIVTACGFNAIRQTEPYEQIHRYLPFPRRYDNQFLRAARRRSKNLKHCPKLT